MHMFLELRKDIEGSLVITGHHAVAQSQSLVDVVLFHLRSPTCYLAAPSLQSSHLKSLSAKQ